MATIDEWQKHFKKKGKAYTERQIKLMKKLDPKIRKELYIDSLLPWIEWRNIK
jgi:hypothetical protein